MKNNHNFGLTLRKLRDESGVPLRVVAAAVGIDSTMVSKLERGERFPTEEQIKQFSIYFRVSAEDLAARAIADKFIMHYGEHPAAEKAIKIIKQCFALNSEERNR